MAARHDDDRTRAGAAGRLPAQGQDGGRPRPPGPEESRGTVATSGGTGPPPPSFRDTLRSRRFWITLVIIALINYLLVPILFPDPADRITIPYTVFKQQVQAGNVAEITSRGDAVQGVFKSPVADPAPPSGQTPRTSTKFATNIPTFADEKALGTLLEEKGV